MDINKKRNIVILKDLPSNLVEEAFVVFKENQKIKRPEFVEKSSERFSGEIDRNNEEDYVVKEAELLISNYISTIEKQDFNNIKTDSRLEKKYKKLKFFSVILLIFSIISFICVIK